MNPADWEFVGLIDNEWDSPSGETLRQRKLTLKSKKPSQILLPARTDGPTFKKPSETPKIDKNGSLFVFSGDDQAPFHDPALHEKYCEFLDQNNPHTIVKIGDTMDFPNISKYKKNPEREEVAKVQDCVNSGYRILKDERMAAPRTKIVKMAGNHDIRLRDFILNWVPELHGLQRAEIIDNNEASIFSPEFLLRLDELGIDYLDPQGPYEHGEFKVSEKLAARHGWIAKKGSGPSALATLEHLGYSVLIGHTHRQSLVYKTTFDINGEPTILCAAEIGCMCLVENDGLGHSPSPDWQPGFSTATVWPDGKFRIDNATYVNGQIFWRDQRF